MDLTSLQILTWLTTPFILKIWSFPDSNNATISRLSPILCVLLLLYGFFPMPSAWTLGFSFLSPLYPLSVSSITYSTQAPPVSYASLEQPSPAEREGDGKHSLKKTSSPTQNLFTLYRVFCLSHFE